MVNPGVTSIVDILIVKWVKHECFDIFDVYLSGKTHEYWYDKQPLGGWYTCGVGVGQLGWNICELTWVYYVCDYNGTIRWCLGVKLVRKYVLRWQFNNAALWHQKFRSIENYLHYRRVQLTITLNTGCFVLMTLWKLYFFKLLKHIFMNE